jgi:hypothetical protein
MNGIVEKIEFEYPDLHLVHLTDGRVIGINGECIVLYSDIDDVYEGGLKDRPTINLTKGATA